MTEGKPLSALEVMARHRKEKEQKAAEPVAATTADLIPVKSEFADAIPQVYDLDPEQQYSEQLIENTIRSIKPLDAYNKFIGKGVGKMASPGNIYVSCPFPWHADPDKPNAANGTTHGYNASLHLESGKFKCFKCELGGDIFTMASIGTGRGHETPGGAEFHRLKEDMAQAFGTRVDRRDNKTVAWRDDDKFAPPTPQTPAEPVTVQSLAAPSEPVQQVPTPPAPEAPSPQAASTPVQEGGEYVGTPGTSAADWFNTQATQAVEQPATVAPASAIASAEAVATVTPLHAVPVNMDEDLDKDIEYASIDWRGIVKPDTFLYEYMVATTQDDCPEEYHFWHAMMALGHAAGRRVMLADRKMVKGNLLVCLLGGTGAGKSKSLSYLTNLLEEVLPFKDQGDRTTGVKDIGSVASGEALIKAYDHLVVDPSTLKPTGAHAGVNGIADWAEFSGLLGRANRAGSTLKSIIIEFADAGKPVRSMSIQNGQLSATDHFCSIISTTQPLAIRTLVDKNDESSGFLNRWIFAGGPEKEKEVFGGAAYGLASADMSRATDHYRYIKGWAATEREIMISDDALPQIVKYFQDEIFPVKKKDDMLARLDLFYKKILLLFAINEKSPVVTLEMHERAKQLIPYLIQCYGLVSEQIGITTSHEIVADIIHHCEKHAAKHGKGITVRELLKAMWRKNYTPEQMNKAIDSMVKAYLIEEEPRTTHLGRPTVRYRRIEA